MRTDRLAWSQVACDNLKKAGATDEIFYYRRVLGKEKYAAYSMRIPKDRVLRKLQNT